MYDVAEVLNHYGIESKPSQEVGELLILCPFHEDMSLGSASFNIRDETFYCFSCGAGGNIYQFVSKLEGCSVREAGVLIENDFVQGGSYSDAAVAATEKAYERTAQRVGTEEITEEVRVFTEQVFRGLRFCQDDAKAAYWIAICGWAQTPGEPPTRALMRHLWELHMAFLTDVKSM